MEKYRISLDILGTKIELGDIDNSVIEMKGEWVDLVVKNWFLQKSIWENPLMLWKFFTQILITFLQNKNIEKIIKQNVIWDEIDFRITLSDNIKDRSLFTIPKDKEYKTEQVILHALKNFWIDDLEAATMTSIWVLSNAENVQEIETNEEWILKKVSANLHKLLIVEKL